MRYLLFILMLLPVAAFAQTKAEYVYVMEHFVTFYNKGQGDKVNEMFSHDWDEMKKTKPMWTNKMCASTLHEYGRILSFKFLGIDTTDPNKVYVFKTVFSKAGKKTTSLTIDRERQLGTFRFITRSPEIERMLAEDK